MLDRLGACYKTVRGTAKRTAIKSLRNYIGPRVAMTDYPRFRALGYDCGSGPTEAACGGLTRRLKGPGMRWDSDNAEAMMALISLHYSGQWESYWTQAQKAA